MARATKKNQPAPIDLDGAGDPAPHVEHAGPGAASSLLQPVVETMPGRPICPYCKVPMTATGSPNLFTYYRCPSGDACGASNPPFRTKIPRTDAIRRLRTKQDQTPEHGPPR